MKSKHRKCSWWERTRGDLLSGQGEFVIGGRISRKSNWRVSLGLDLRPWQERLNFIPYTAQSPGDWMQAASSEEDSRADGGAGNQ